MSQPVLPAETPQKEPDASAAAQTAVSSQSPSIVARLFGVLKREPVLFITVAYLFVSLLGLWSSFWFYRRFEVPILEYMQSSDFFVAGLRRPQFALLLGAALFWLWLSAWPMRWVERNRDLAKEYRRKYWWGKHLFYDPQSWQGLWGIRSDTLLVISFLGLGLFTIYNFSLASARDILSGKDKGHRVWVTLAMEGAPTAEASLLGTTSAFVFLWRVDTRRAEIVPIESIAKMESINPPKAPTARPAADTGKATQ